MARIEDLRLPDRGRRRRAEFTLTSTIIWEAVDAGRNGGEILVRFFGQDSGEDDVIWNYVQWVVKEQSDRTEFPERSWEITAESIDRTRFQLDVEDVSGIFFGRRFNEDIPGRDEVYAIVMIRDTDGINISERIRTNTVRGRY